MKKFSLAKDPERPLIVLKTLVFAVAAGCVASDVVFFTRGNPDNYGLLIWRIPLESVVCLTYLISLVNPIWHRVRHKHKTIGKRRLLWLTPVILALVALVITDMIQEMVRVQEWRDAHPALKEQPDDPGTVVQFWTCALSNAFYQSSSTAIKTQYGPEVNVDGWTGYCVPRNFGWCGGLVLALVFAADVAYTYAFRHQLQAKNELAMKQEEEQHEQGASVGKLGEAHALTQVPPPPPSTTTHSRTTDNLIV